MSANSERISNDPGVTHYLNTAAVFCFIVIFGGCTGTYYDIYDNYDAVAFESQKKKKKKKRE